MGMGCSHRGQSSRITRPERFWGGSDVARSHRTLGQTRPVQGQARAIKQKTQSSAAYAQDGRRVRVGTIHIIVLYTCASNTARKTSRPTTTTRKPAPRQHRLVRSSPRCSCSTPRRRQSQPRPLPWTCHGASSDTHHVLRTLTPPAQPCYHGTHPLHGAARAKPKPAPHGHQRRRAMRLCAARPTPQTPQRDATHRAPWGGRAATQRCGGVLPPARSGSRARSHPPKPTRGRHAPTEPPTSSGGR